MMSVYVVEVTIVSASGLKNVNTPEGVLKPYVIVWIDPATKGATGTNVDCHRNTDPVWNEKFNIPLVERPIDDAILYFELFHALDGIKPVIGSTSLPLIGSATLPLRHIVEDVGFGHNSTRTLQLKDLSLGSQGKLEVKVTINDPLGISKPAPKYDPSGSPLGFSGPPPTEYPASAPPLPPWGNTSGSPPDLQRLWADSYSHAMGMLQPYVQPPWANGGSAPYMQQPWANGGSALYMQQPWAGAYGGALPYGGSAPYMPQPYGGASPHVPLPWAGAGAYGAPAPPGGSSYLKHGATVAGLLFNMMSGPSGSSALSNLFK